MGRWEEKNNHRSSTSIQIYPAKLMILGASHQPSVVGGEISFHGAHLLDFAISISTERPTAATKRPSEDALCLFEYRYLKVAQ